MLPSLGVWQPNYRIDRKEEVTLARLRIGHTFITHSFLLKGDDDDDDLKFNDASTHRVICV